MLENFACVRAPTDTVFHLCHPLQQDKRREMEYSKIHTLRLMLAQEKKTRDALNATNASHKEDIQKSDAKIKKLQEQLKQVCGEVSARLWAGDTNEGFALQPTV